jgi:heme exporter protein A
MLLDVQNLTCRRGDARVLAGVTFSVRPGTALVLRGPNGSGKTTLLRTLAGLTPPVAGTVSAPAEAMAYAGHHDGIKAQLSVAENLAFWARIFGTRSEAAAMAAFNLDSLSGRLAHNLSAGQKRRLGLARLLVNGRPIWLLDEPTVSLDADHVAMFAQMVAVHLTGGGTAVIATHIDLGLARAETLDVSAFRAGDGGAPLAEDPFLAGDFA